MAYFTIQPGTDHLTLDSKTRNGSVLFSAQNKTGAERRVRALVMVTDDAQERWYTIKEPVKPARVDEMLQFPVDVTVPPDVAPGEYGFRLKVVAEDDPDDVADESQQLTVEVPAGRPEKFPWWIFAVVAALIVVAVLVWLFVSRGGGIVTVPDVTSLALPAAQERLTGRGLEMGDVTEEPSAEQPEGHVVRQDPRGGTDVDEGTAVDLLVSTGLVAVPVLEGLTVDDAGGELEASRLALGGVTEEPSTEHPAGVIVTQDPAAGTEVEPGAAVDVVVSSGPPDERIAHYPLASDGDDALGLQEPMTLANTTFSNGGVFCNGVYAFQPGGCNVITPRMEGFDFDSFSIAVEFQVADAASVPVIVGGNSFRWTGFLLNDDRTVSLLYNNSQRENCGGSYQLGVWQTALVTYDGAQGRLYLNGELRCTTSFALNHGDDSNVGVNNFSNATVLRGWIRNLEVHDQVIVP